MSNEPTDRTEDEAAQAVAELAAEAERDDRAEQASAEGEADDAQWEDVAAQEQQARALAKMGVQGVELAAGMIRPGHALDATARRNGEEALLPVALDFSGEVPEWLRPYMHYLAAGLWIGGVLVGAVKAKREDDASKAAEDDREQRQAEGMADGV